MKTRPATNHHGRLKTATSALLKFTATAAATAVLLWQVASVPSASAQEPTATPPVVA